jgi:hypothetical protein
MVTIHSQANMRHERGFPHVFGSAQILGWFIFWLDTIPLPWRATRRPRIRLSVQRRQMAAMPLLQFAAFEHD